MSQELKPCPFCGSREASVCERDSMHFVMCEKCTAEGPAMEGVQSVFEAKEEWNRRTPAEQPAPASNGREPDVIPVRLPSGGKAIVQVPGKFTIADGVHLMNFLTEYLDERVEGAPVAARELDVEAERLTDTEIENLWHEACLKHLDLVDSAIPDFARAIEAEVAARFRAEGGNTKPDGAGQNTEKTAETRMDTGFLVLAESAPVSTEQAGDARHG